MNTERLDCYGNPILQQTSNLCIISIHTNNRIHKQPSQSRGRARLWILTVLKRQCCDGHNWDVKGKKVKKKRRGLREKSKRAIFNGSKIGKKYRKKRVKSG